MRESKYIATGLNMLDVIDIEGTIIPASMGGIPMYGFCGMRPWTESIEFVGRVGNDFFSIFDPWFTNNHINPRSLHFVSETTPYNVMCYDKDMNGIPGGYFFTHNWADSDHWRPHPGDFDECIGPETKGFYVCGAPQESPFWNDVFDLKDRYGFKIMWEPNASHTFSKDKEDVISLCKKIDMASFNVPEGKRIFEIESEEELIEYLKDLGPELILLRCGAHGLYTIHNKQVYFIPSVKLPEGCSVVDTTGCGNTSTSGACVAWCEGNDPIMTGIMANISSSYNLRQKGPYPLFDDKLMTEAKDLADKLYSEGAYKKL